MKNCKLILLCVLAVLSTGLFAQNITVKGTVTDASSGEGVAYAGVLVKGGNTITGTTSDENGQYQITVPSNATLIFSAIGFTEKEVAVDGRAVIDVQLAEDAEMLDETIVVAYGTAKKSSFTGSASTVSSEKLEKRTVSNVSNALSGTVAGVQSYSASGTPGSGSTILIRGIGSISGSKTPLIIVDGVPYEGSLNSISTQDIESMTVLKDAAANSMYGARGANGVIIIMTKGSKSSKAKVNFEARAGVNVRAVPNYDIVTDPGEWYELAFEAYRNQLAGDLGYANANLEASENLIANVVKYNIYKDISDGAIIDPATGKLSAAARNASLKWNDSWLTDPFRKGIRQEYNVNVSGGNDGTQAYASLGYLGDQGYMVGSGFSRISTRVKVDQNINRNIRIGGNVSYAYTKQQLFNSNVGSNYSNIFMFSQNIAPVYPIYMYDENGNPVKDAMGNIRYDFGDEGATRPYGSGQNPLAVAKENIYWTLRDNLSSRGYFEWKFLEDFTFTANVAYDVFNTNETAYSTPIGGDSKNVGGRGSKGAYRTGALNLNQILNWKHHFGRHEVTLMGVHETNQVKSGTLEGQMTNFADYANPEFANAARYQDLTSYTTEYALESYLLKGEYQFADRYYLTASIRRDGSSRFATDKRWGSFWALGASWRIKEEAFLKGVTWLDNLKLKASYGTQGNDSVGYVHNYTDLYRVDRSDGEPALNKVSRGNKDLTWEKSNNFNVGFEMGLWDRIDLNFDYFIKETKDLLYYSPLKPSDGSPNGIYRNEMDMRNNGFEVEISADIIKTSDVKWNVGFNATHYRNRLTRLPESKPASEFPNGYNTGNYWRQLGGSLYDWYTYDYAGVDPETGKPLFNKWEFKKDESGKETSEYVQVMNEDGTPKQFNNYSDAGQVRVNKSPFPDLTGGISTFVEAYGFDLSIQASYQVGGWIDDSFYSSLMSGSGQGHNYHKDLFNRWTPSNRHTDIPAIVYNTQNTSPAGTFFLTKASYFNLNNVTLGYSLPSRLLKKINLERLRLYVSGDNVWLKSARKGLDPRQGYDGTTGYVYSALGTYSVGVNVTF